MRREKRDRIEAETKIAQRQWGRAERSQFEKRVPGIIAGNRRSAAQVSAGKLRTETRDKESAARSALDAAERRVRDDNTSCGSTCPTRSFPRGAASRRSATASARWVIQGPERVALIGPNGAGKTTLLDHLLHGAS